MSHFSRPQKLGLYHKLKLFDLTGFYNLNYLRSTTLGCKDIRNHTCGEEIILLSYIRAHQSERFLCIEL